MNWRQDVHSITNGDWVHGDLGLNHRSTVGDGAEDEDGEKEETAEKAERRRKQKVAEKQKQSWRNAAMATMTAT
jgi:hypothetical protein